MALSAQEKYREAEPVFDRLCRENSRDPDNCYYLGRVRFTVGDFASSKVAFEHALRTGGRPGRTWLGLALTLDRMDDAVAAEHAFRRALELKEPTAARDYAYFLVRAGRSDEAIVLLRKSGLTEDIVRIERAVPRKAGARPKGVQFTPVELPHETRNGAYGRKHLPETMIAGVAVLDYDRDGLPDIFLPNGAALPSLVKEDASYSNRLFRNLGKRSFEDRTEATGLGGEGYAMNGVAGDFDGDGFDDLFVPGVTSSHLFRNDGSGTFRDVTVQAGLPQSSPWAVAAAFLDYDRDGHLDLFVVRYVQWNPETEPACDIAGHETYCHPEHYRALANALYRNRGDGTFEDVTVASGLSTAIGKGMGAAVWDVNEDGWPDVFVANDTTPNFLFLNLGNGKFREVGLQAGVALKDDGVPVSAMGAAFADFDGDGRADFLVSSLSDETFLAFRATGPGTFEDAGLATGLVMLSRSFTGWGVVTGDFNGDGFADFAVACGHVQDNAEKFSSRSSRQPVVLFLNRGNGTFERQEIGEPSFYRGLAVADFDRDGRPDLVVTRLNERPVVFFNDGVIP